MGCQATRTLLALALSCLEHACSEDPPTLAVLVVVKACLSLTLVNPWFDQ
jgi:hypothetical protein